MFRNRRLCLGPFGEVHNSRDPLAPRRLSSLLAMETKTPRCPPYRFRVRQLTTIIYVDPVGEISDQTVAAVFQTYCVHLLVWARSPIVG